MAVDIYCYIERLTVDGWVFTGEIGPNEEHRYEPEAPKLAPVPTLHSVNKELASILLDTGWAIRAATPYVAVAPRRGRPIDLSSPLAEHFKYYDDDAGTVYSWFTAQELSSFDLASHVITREAYVDPRVAQFFIGCPFGFPSDQWPSDIPISFAGWSRDGVEVRWMESYDTIVKEFIDVVVPVLSRHPEPSHTRLIIRGNW